MNLYAHCENDSINYWDSTDHFMISKDVLIYVIIGTFLGAGVGFGIAAYYDYKDDSEIFNRSLAWYDYIDATLLCGTIGALVDDAIGCSVCYLAGGIYGNCLVSKSVESVIKSFLSQASKVHHVLGQSKHKLIGYASKIMGQVMKNTLAKGGVGA